MSQSVVIFGMAHSGKSTLMGYLIAHNENIDVDNLENLLKKRYGADYDEEQIYAYIVNTHKDEIRKTNNNSGSTKSNHYKKITIDENIITIIDTPGFEHKDKDRKKGMFYSDIGVFCIELSQIIDDNFLNTNRLEQIIPQLMLWTHLKKEVIILLTKTDLVDYSKNEYNKAINNIQYLCSEINLEAQIIPVSINTLTRNSHNILSVSTTKMPWYRGEAFYNILKEKLKNIKSAENNNLLFYIDKQYNSPESHTGKSWRIKVLSGKLRVGDKIMLAPVKIGMDKSAVISCRVKTLRYDINRGENPEIVDAIGEGDFAGIDICDIKYNKRTINKNEFDVLNVTCGFHFESYFKVSNRVVAEISKEHSRLLNVRSKVNLIWFGRTVGAQIVAATVNENTNVIEFKLESKYVALPIIEGKLCFGSIIIDTCTQKYNNIIERTEHKYIDAKLLDLKEGI